MVRNSDINELTLGDLFRARDAYQVHLTSLPNVVATAVGLYLAREDETESTSTFGERLALAPGKRPKRTLENSRAVEWSWPVVLVFVDDWLTAPQIRKRPDDMVPRQLYLPDGRVVPTCVVYAPSTNEPPSPGEHLSFPSSMIGGGYVCLADVQGQERAASLACLVTDGDRIFALTNRHVAGAPGRRLYTEVNGSRYDIGVSASKSVGHVSMTTAYPGLGGDDVQVAVDAGLVELDDATNATTQVFGVGPLGGVVDIGAHSMRLNLIGQPVRAFGGASGPLAGEIVALSYRYKTLAGTDYVADVLIGPRAGRQLSTRHGDSGTLWVTDGPPLGDLRPLALQWGGHRFAASHGPSPFALATFASTALATLDVDIIADWNADLATYWGVTGHYTIGARACDLVKPAKLRAFFVANRDRIAFELADIENGAFLTEGGVFTPLADVPDRVWKHPPRGQPHRGREGPNHFADMDDPDADGHTLLSLYADDPATLDPAAWHAFYTKLPAAPSLMHEGMLPFRVAQLYRLALVALGKQDSLTATALLGVMAHYVGDACQPLHVSRFHDGRDPQHPTGVHSAYEDKMLDAHRKDLIAGLDTALAGTDPMPTVTGHREAARAILELMRRTVERLPPGEICDAWTVTPAVHPAALWQQFGDRTIQCIADGCRTLAMLWSSVFAEANAPAPPAQPLSKTDLAKLYNDETFAESMTIVGYRDSGLW